MVNFAGKHWEVSVTRNVSLFHGSFDVGSEAIETKIYGTVPHNFFYLVQEGRKAFLFSNQEDVKLYYKRLEKLCVSSQSFGRLEKIYFKLGSALQKSSVLLEKDFSLKNYRTFCRAYLALSPSLYLTTALGRHMHSLLSERLAQLYPARHHHSREALMGDITYPSGHTPLSLSQFSLLHLGAWLQKNKVNVKNIKKHKPSLQMWHKHIELYSFIPVNFNEEPWSEQDVTAQLKTFLRKDCALELKKFQANHRLKVRQAALSLKAIKDNKVKLLATVLQKTTLLNEYRKYCFCRASLSYRPLFKAIAKKYKLSHWQECWKLTYEEIERLYYYQDVSVLKLLSQRNTVALSLDFSNRKLVVHTGRVLKLFLSELNKKHKTDDTNSAQEISGTIANIGMVRGIARVIMGRYDFPKFKDKDIIVTSMTSVDFVPIMERASAFVTNEGGITSHASIVSRELNKPCIIGTKIGTKIIQDGDLLEVDATHGVVRILKRGK